MNTLVTAYGDKIDSDAYEVIVVELSSLIWYVCPELPQMFFFLSKPFMLVVSLDE